MKKTLFSLLVGFFAFVLIVINCTNAKASTVDTTGPVIIGAKDLVVFAGDPISYKKGIEVKDDTDPKPSLKVDNSAVNPVKPGVYPVVYVATDKSGNETRVTVKLTVCEKPKPWTEESIKELAQEIVALKTTPSMNDLEKAKALFDYTHRVATYSAVSGDTSSIYAGAYEALVLKQTDCFGFAAAYQVLLDAAGIENVMVQRVGGTSHHYWNLVHIPQGWYHCDTSPRSLKLMYKCFMQTDAQLADYTEKYTKMFPGKPNYYTFDSTLYPKRATKKLY